MQGLYQHYKGGRYRVIGTARHTEHEGELVIYQGARGELWARPRAMFEGRVTLADGREVRRFAPVEKEVEA